MSLFPFVAKAVLPAAGFFGVKLWWRWRSFNRDVAKFRQRAVELKGREARRIARTGLLELAEGAAKERGVYRFFTRVMAKQVLREVIADVREATHRREPREGPSYFRPGSEAEEVEEWTGRMYVASLTLDDEDFGMYGGVGPARQDGGRQRASRD